MVDKTEKDNALFAFQDVGPYRVKQLSFGELTSIMGMIVPLFDKISPAIPAGGITSLPDILRVSCVILPDVTPILATLLKVPEQEIADLPAATAVRLIVTYWQLNADLLLDFFAIGGGVNGKVS